MKTSIIAIISGLFAALLVVGTASDISEYSVIQVFAVSVFTFFVGAGAGAGVMGVLFGFDLERSDSI